MINFADITNEVFEVLSSDGAVVEYFRNITRGRLINQDPAVTPWLGVYRKSIDYDPRAISTTRQWQAEMQVTVLVQAAGLRYADNVEEIIEEGVQLVITSLNNKKNLNGKVLMLTAINVEYAYNPDMQEDMSYQQAEITLTYEARS